jgi:crossover junction endodeoxyribonuclease RuvC
VFSHVNVRSALALAQARGLVLAVAGMAGLPVFSYPPARVKKAVTGRGRASKDQVARMVRVLVGLKRTPASDAADALAVAIAHAHAHAMEAA